MASYISIPQIVLLAFSLYSIPSQAHPSAAPAPKVISLDFDRRQVVPVNGLNKRGLNRRAASTYSSPLYNAEGDTLYLVNVTVGTPPQQLQLQIDTGSSDLWLPWAGAALCKSSGDLCPTGAYDNTASTSYVEVSLDGFDISYADSTQIHGDYIDETVTVGGATIKKMLIGLATSAQEPQTGEPLQGIIGVGFVANEAIFQQSQGQTSYPNFVERLVVDGLIKTRAYSVWLNDLYASSGSILFGGVDTAKYHGDLVALPLQQDVFNSTLTPANLTSFNVLLDNVVITGNAKKTVYSANVSVPVILDSGTSLTYLPEEFATTIANGVGAVNINETLLIPCSVASTPATITFQFGNSNGPSLVIPIGQFVIPFSADEPAYTLPKGGNACTWGILASAAGDSNLFGDSFMRSGYFVYDLDGKQVAMAQTNFNATTSNIQEISTAGSIPGVKSTATGTIPAAENTGAASATSVGTATFDLGAATGTAASGGKKGAGSSLQPPSKSITVAVAGGLTVLFGMVGGSMLAFV